MQSSEEILDLGYSGVRDFFDPAEFEQLRKEIAHIKQLESNLDKVGGVPIEKLRERIDRVYNAF